MKPKIRVIIPAFNEQNAVGNVIREIPRDLVEEIIVVNNASTDDTERVALKENATVLHEPVKGYGNGGRNKDPDSRLSVCSTPAHRLPLYAYD